MSILEDKNQPLTDMFFVVPAVHAMKMLLHITVRRKYKRNNQ